VGRFFEIILSIVGFLFVLMVVKVIITGTTSFRDYEDKPLKKVKEVNPKEVNQKQKKPVLELTSAEVTTKAVLSKAQYIAYNNNMDWEKIYDEAMTGDSVDLFKTLYKYFDVQ
jgi:hypothetical protein